MRRRDRQIIDQPCRHPGLRSGASIINHRGFTLIELLVVISILVMVMAILLPTAERVRKQAKAAACLARVHQWGLVFKMYTDTNSGRWFEDPIREYTERSGGDWVGLGDQKTSILNWAGLTSPFWSRTPGLLACPMGTKWLDWSSYDAFTAWWPKQWGPFTSPSGEPTFGPISYTVNRRLAWPPPQDPRNPVSPKDVYWGICDVRGAGNIPVFFDSAYWWAGPVDYVGPPPLEAGLRSQITAWPMCINRHDAGVNMLFMDWSVRKVGLKELWTFKWSRKFKTAGPWTKAGGALWEDWPAWMRRFKDY